MSEPDRKNHTTLLRKGLVGYGISAVLGALTCLVISYIRRPDDIHVSLSHRADAPTISANTTSKVNAGHLSSNSLAEADLVSKLSLCDKLKLSPELRSSYLRNPESLGALSIDVILSCFEDDQAMAIDGFRKIADGKWKEQINRWVANNFTRKPRLALSICLSNSDSINLGTLSRVLEANVLTGLSYADIIGITPDHSKSAVVECGVAAALCENDISHFLDDFSVVINRLDNEKGEQLVNGFLDQAWFDARSTSEIGAFIESIEDPKLRMFALNKNMEFSSRIK